MRFNIGAVAFLAVAGLLVLNPTLQAQTNSAAAARRGARGPTVERQVERLSTELKLTDAQKSKVKGVLEEENKKNQELRKDTALSREERNAKRRSLREESNKKMKEILSPEQFKKYEEAATQRRQQRGRRGQNQNGAGAAAN